MNEIYIWDERYVEDGAIVDTDLIALKGGSDANENLGDKNKQS